MFQDEQKRKQPAKANDILFFTKTEHVTTAILENRRTLNVLNTTIFLPNVIDTIRTTNRKHHIILHHDNSSSHIAKQTITYCLNEKNIKIMIHPSSFRPELTHCDFFLFSKIKNTLHSQRLSSPEKAFE